MAESKQSLQVDVANKISVPTLQAIWEKFEQLKHCRDDAYGMDAGHGETSTWTLSHDELHAKVIDPIDTQLFELAWAASDLRAKNREELQLKARILEEYIVHDDEDLTAGLTRSLLRDVLNG